MIAALSGKVIHQDGESLVLDVNGVGYEITVVHTVFGAIESTSRMLSVLTYMDVRENAISLFGFASKEEKQVFLLLRKVKGIGSKLALAIISTLGARELLTLLATGEAKELQKVPGVGKKTAERIMVELYEQVGELAKGTSLPVEKIRIDNSSSTLVLGTPALGSGLPSAAEDASLALQKLGFSREQAEGALQRTVAGLSDAKSVLPDAGELVRLSLANI